MIVRRQSLVAAFAAVFICASSGAQEDEAPSDGFLEYLATLVEQDGEWVDALELDEVPTDDIDPDIEQRASENSESAEETP